MANNLGPAISLIKQFEGCRLEAYPDVGRIWSIGYGTTKDVTQGMKITQQQAEDFLMRDVNEVSEQIESLIDVQINNNMFCAILCFTYNVGVHSLFNSSLLAKLNAGFSKDEIANEFLKWNHAGGKIFAGLNRRRQAERKLFLK